MSVDETLMCSFQILKPSEKKTKYQYGGMSVGRPVTPPRTATMGIANTPTNQNSQSNTSMGVMPGSLGTQLKGKK